jgi:hypothetical protein
MITTDRVTSTDGTSIAFERTGTGPALILVDAASCFRDFGPMRPLAALLASRFTVFAYDRRGRGESTDTQPYAVDREVDDLEALAHTLVYDTVITSSFPSGLLARVTAPALVLASEGSDDRLLGWARGLSQALPNALLRLLKGEWHGVPAEELAPVLAEFFLER